MQTLAIVRLEQVQIMQVWRDCGALCLSLSDTLCIVAGVLIAITMVANKDFAGMVTAIAMVANKDRYIYAMKKS